MALCSLPVGFKHYLSKVLSKFWSIASNTLLLSPYSNSFFSQRKHWAIHKSSYIHKKAGAIRKALAKVQAKTEDKSKIAVSDKIGVGSNTKGVKKKNTPVNIDTEEPVIDLRNKLEDVVVDDEVIDMTGC